MQSRCYIIGAFVLLVAITATYIIRFFGFPVSENTSDWGAFGSYISIGISALSIALIYVTYNEQRKSNQISRFEQHFRSMLETAAELVKKSEKEISVDYPNFINHFSDPFFDFTGIEVGKLEGTCTYLLSRFVQDEDRNYEHLFKYIYMTIQCIKNEPLLEPDEKEGRTIELACVLPESIRNLFFCWLIQKDHDILNYCYRNGFFIADSPRNGLLSDIIKLVCTGEKPPKEEVAPIDDIIDYEGKDPELFYDIYKQLYNTKQKQQ